MTRNTIYYVPKSNKEILKDVYNALIEQGYDPITQLEGYFVSGDSSYITTHNNAREKMLRIDKDWLLYEMVNEYIKK